jgi:integrase
MNLKRTSYQQGSLTTEKRKSGPAVWVYRWRETDTHGRRVRRKTTFGKAEFPTKASALKHVAALGLDINNESTAQCPRMTLAELIEHYRKVELIENGRKTARTIAVYKQQIRQYILPKWGGCEIGRIKTVAVEAWLGGLPGAPATKAKTRNVMSSLFQHARRYEFVLANPISLVRQGAKRLKEPEVLTPEEVHALLAELSEPARTIVHLVACTGLRRGELFGLEWGDVDFKSNQVKIVRSIVDQAVGKTKTQGSKRPMPLSEDVVLALVTWRGMTQYGRDQDWIFASPQLLGELPLWPNTVLIRHVMPAAERAGITKRIGWHTFRHTFATLLQATGAGMKVTQELLRHSSPLMTMGTYAQALTDDKREGQAKVAALYLVPKREEPAA